MRAGFVATLAVLTTASAAPAAEPSGCDKFKWPIERERAALTSADRAKLASGADVSSALPMSAAIGLKTPANAALPVPPERAPKKDDTFAGFANFKAAPKAGVYTVSLSQGAWVDVVQDGKILKPVAFSGATDCDGIRKTMKYDLAAKPFVVQISGVAKDSVDLAILPAD